MYSSVSMFRVTCRPGDGSRRRPPRSPSGVSLCWILGSRLPSRIFLEQIDGSSRHFPICSRLTHCDCDWDNSELIEDPKVLSHAEVESRPRSSYHDELLHTPHGRLAVPEQVTRGGETRLHLLCSVPHEPTCCKHSAIFVIPLLNHTIPFGAPLRRHIRTASRISFKESHIHSEKKHIQLSAIMVHFHDSYTPEITGINS